MDNDREKKEEGVEEEIEDEELGLVEMMGNRTNFEEASETIRTRGFIKGMRL